jgi:hypothetical protein
VPFAFPPERARRLVPALVFVLVLAVRAVYWAALEASPLSGWHFWMETDEWGYVDWSARLAAGNWLDVPAWRPYFSWQEPYGSREAWEKWYRKNAYYSGPLYPYTLALIRRAGLPLLPSVRLLQLLLACAAAAAIAAATQAVAGRFLPVRKRDYGGAAAVAGPSFGPVLAGLIAGLLYGLYGPLVFHDGFACRDGPVAHVSALLLALPLLATAREGEPGGTSSKGRKETGALLLGLLGGAATLLKQTLLPLAVISVYCYSKKFATGIPRRRVVGAALVGLGLPLAALTARNVAAGVPPLTFDTRQAASVAWANGRGADGTTAPSPAMKPILDAAGGSTWKTAWLVVKSYADAPWELPRLWAKKAVTFFLSYEVPDNSNWYFFRDRLPVLGVLPVFPCIVGLGLVGLFAAYARGALEKSEEWLVAVAALTPLASCVLAVTTSRYRASVVAPLALGLGLSLVLFFDGWRARERARALLLFGSGVIVSLVSALFPSPIPTPSHRWSDTIVAATLAEARDGPAAALAEIDRYRISGRDDPGYQRGLQALSVWLAGDRTSARVAPAGMAPPEARLKVREAENGDRKTGRGTGKDASR